MSDSNGYIYDEEGINKEKLAYIMEMKNVRRGRIKEYTDKYKKAVYTPRDPIWIIILCGIIKPIVLSIRNQNESMQRPQNLIKKAFSL